MTIPYTFAGATTAIPLAQLDANFASPITLGNVAMTLSNTYTSIGNLTLTNVTISSASGLAANTVAYANASGVLGGSANLTFDGSTLTTLNSAYTGTLTGGTGVVNLGSGQFYKDASGNVGIGTTSPNYSLEIVRAGQPVLTLRSTGAASGAAFNLLGTTGFTNWQVGASSVATNGALEITPSTAAGGSTFSTPTLSFNSTGAVVLKGGNVAANGTGLTFPATQDASSNANTLDDYEKGTWTPNVGGSATYTTQQGYYTKVGQLVFAQFHLTINSIGSGTASQIYGLPFASKNDGSAPGIHIGYFATWNTTSYYIGGYKNAADASIILTNTTAPATSLVNGASMLKNGSDLYCSVTYIAA